MYNYLPCRDKLHGQHQIDVQGGDRERTHLYLARLTLARAQDPTCLFTYDIGKQILGDSGESLTWVEYAGNLRGEINLRCLDVHFAGFDRGPPMI